MDPRISFSYDFVVGQQPMKHENAYREAPVSSDFEFSVKNYSMITPADEVFSQGMLLPKKVTLRDELLINNDDYDKDLPRQPKSSSRWKERFGLKRGASKKEKSKSSTEGFLQRVATVSKES